MTGVQTCALPISACIAGKLLMSGYQMIAVGGNLADKKAIQAGDYRKISSLARAYKEIVDTAV